MLRSGQDGERVLEAACQVEAEAAPIFPQWPAIRTRQGVEGGCGVHTSLETPEHVFGSMGACFCTDLQRTGNVPFQTKAGLAASCLSPGSPSHSMSDPGRSLWVSEYLLLMNPWCFSCTLRDIFF